VTPSDTAERPNILFFHVDNLGFGELSCYSGGPFRGAVTERIDAFAGDGLRLTNYCPESQCTPTRSALLTGRHAVRSGTHSVPIGAPGGWGLVAWERTLGDLLTDAGYACAVYGKWHVGEGPGRWPTDKGFAEWYGPPRTYEEALWPTDPFYDPGRDPVSRMLEIRRGEPDVTEREQLTLDVRRDCDTEYLRRATAFARRGPSTTRRTAGCVEDPGRTDRRGVGAEHQRHRRRLDQDSRGHQFVLSSELLLDQPEARRTLPANHGQRGAAGSTAGDGENTCRVPGDRHHPAGP